MEKGKGACLSGESLGVSLSKKELKKINSTINLALGGARGFTEIVGFSKRFDLDKDRAELFEHYFAYYLILEDGHEAHFSLHSPFIHGDKSNLEKADILNQIMAQQLLNSAKSIAEKITAGSPNALRNAANNLSIDFIKWANDKSKNKPPLKVAMEKPLSEIKLY